MTELSNNVDVSMRRFYFKRDEDESGVSGTGVVAEGCEFTDGSVAIRWKSDKPCMMFWGSIKAAREVHGHGGKTRIVWKDEAPEEDEQEEESSS